MPNPTRYFPGRLRLPEMRGYTRLLFASFYHSEIQEVNVNMKVRLPEKAEQE
jgi:hypothetical protein